MNKPEPTNPLLEKVYGAFILTSVASICTGLYNFATPTTPILFQVPILDLIQSTVFSPTAPTIEGFIAISLYGIIIGIRKEDERIVYFK